MLIIIQELQSGKDLGFERVVFCNIGNPQQLNQKPITFFRQVRTRCCITHGGK